MVNDARLNSKVWKNSLFVKIRRNLSSKEMEYPFQKRLVRRFRKLPVISVIMTALLLTVMFLWGKGYLLAPLTASSCVVGGSLGNIGRNGGADRLYSFSSAGCQGYGDLVDQIYAVRERGYGNTIYRQIPIFMMR